MDKKMTVEEFLRMSNELKFAQQRKKIASLREFQKAVALSVQSITEDERIWIRKVLSKEDSVLNDKLTENELNWVKQVLVDDKGYDFDDIIKLQPSFLRLKKAEYEQWENRERVREELDAIRKGGKKFTPKELIELRNKNERKTRGIGDFPGIYIIHNREKDIYYIGKSEGVFGRAYQHFVTNPAENEARYKWTVEFNLPEIYDDYRLGDKFHISLIPIEKTSFSTLDDLERYAISVYNASVEHGGYNRTQGNIIKKVFFKNDDDHLQVANFILNKIKGTEGFLSRISNHTKRCNYTHYLFLELVLPKNQHFFYEFIDFLKNYKNTNKKERNKRS